MLAREVAKLLKAKGLTVALAESCTGGRACDLMTDVPGSSDYFLGGIVSYSNEAKVDLLGVDKETLRTKGAVSEEVALKMAAGARKAFNAKVGVGITGIAGPSGGTPTKPVGLVYIALSSDFRSVCAKNVFDGDRTDVKKQAAKKALEMLKDFLSAAR